MREERRINFLIDEKLYDKFKAYVKKEKDTMTRLLINYIKDLVE